MEGSQHIALSSFGWDKNLKINIKRSTKTPQLFFAQSNFLKSTRFYLNRLAVFSFVALCAFYGALGNKFYWNSCLAMLLRNVNNISVRFIYLKYL